MNSPTLDSLPTELLCHIAFYLPRGAIPSLAATSNVLRYAVEFINFRTVRIRAEGGLVMFAQAFRKEEGWRRELLRDVSIEVGIGITMDLCENDESRLFTQRIARLLRILAEWEVDGSGTVTDNNRGASGAGGIKLTIQVIWNAYKPTVGLGYWTLKLLAAENEVEIVVPKVTRIVGLNVIGSCGSMVEAASVVKLAARMPGLRQWGMAVPAKTDITWMDCDSLLMQRVKAHFSQTVLRALLPPDSNAITASFNNLTTFTLCSSRAESDDRRRLHQIYRCHSSQGEGKKDPLSQALHAISRLPNLEQLCLLTPVGLSSEVFWPSASAKGLAGGSGDGEEPFWPKLQVLKVMFAAERPGGGWYTASPPQLLSEEYPPMPPLSVFLPRLPSFDYVHQEGGWGGASAYGDVSSGVTRFEEGMGHTSLEGTGEEEEEQEDSGDDEEGGDEPIEWIRPAEVNYSVPLLSASFIHPPTSLDYPPVSDYPPGYNATSTTSLPSTEPSFYPLTEPFYPDWVSPHRPSPTHILIDPTAANPVLIASSAASESRQSHDPFLVTTSPDTFNPVLTALGKAVSRMPKLKIAEVRVDVGGKVGNEILFTFLGTDDRGAGDRGAGAGEIRGWSKSPGIEFQDGGTGPSMGERASRWLMRVGMQKRREQLSEWESGALSGWYRRYWQ